MISRIPLTDLPENQLPEEPCREVPAKNLPQVEADRQLVELCLEGDSAAWSQLYSRFHDRLLASIRPALGSLAGDLSLVDEVAARVWYSLVRNDFQLLARFDASRGCQFSTFLGMIAKCEVKQVVRNERHRRSREIKVSKPDIASDWGDVGFNALEEDFLDTLTPAERAFYKEVLSVIPNDVSARKYSRSNAWQLTCRVKAKLTGFLFDGENC